MLLYATAMTAYCTYSRLRSISGRRFLYPQPEDVPCLGDRDPENKVLRKISGAKRNEIKESGESYIMLSYMDFMLRLI